jgi:hypothetical protein
VHQGPYNILAEEDDSRLNLGPNFYYRYVVYWKYLSVLMSDLFLRQEDILKELGAKYGFDYSVTRPMTIIGALKGNYLNLA